MKSTFIPTKDLVTKALALTVKNGGATINPKNGETVTTGYAVGGIREFKFHSARLGQFDEIVAACKTIRAEHKTCMLGFWMDEGTLYVDAINVTKIEEAARIVAETFGELAYFNLDTNTEVRL
jgi:hypothetical protein